MYFCACQCDTLSFSPICALITSRNFSPYLSAFASPTPFTQRSSAFVCGIYMHISVSEASVNMTYAGTLLVLAI